MEGRRQMFLLSFTFLTFSSFSALLSCKIGRRLLLHLVTSFTKFNSPQKISMNNRFIISRLTHYKKLLTESFYLIEPKII